MKIKLKVNGLAVDAHYSQAEIENVHKPLLRRLAALHAVSSQYRTLVFLSAPPGTGKSTLTTFWQYLAHQDASLPAIQTLPMDGFHHYNSWLEQHDLRPFKGMPDTFDVEKLAENLQQIRQQDGTWPQYDRQLHDPVEEAINVTAPIVIIEGNWLLLDDERWRTLVQYCDFSLFIRAPAEVLAQRLIDRKIAGGLTPDDAMAFYLRTDGPNVERVLQHSRAADMTLIMKEEGEYHFADARAQV